MLIIHNFNNHLLLIVPKMKILAYNAQSMLYILMLIVRLKTKQHY